MSNKTKIEIEVPKGISFDINGTLITIKGKKGTITKNFNNPLVEIKKEGNKILMITKKDNKRSRAVVNSYRAHLRNFFKGVEEGYIYKLKICSGHFPMSVSVSNNKLIIKNFLGEKIPRELQIKPGVNVKVDGNFVIVESVDKELAGQVSADIERTTRRPNFDRRIFQDGIYIIEKAGEPI